MKKIFIGSSSKALEKAFTIKEILEDLGAKAVCWRDTEAFPLSENTIDILIESAHKYNGGVFILDKDDTVIENDGKEKHIPRDNVLVEAGMFAGVLGKQSVVLCTVPDVHEITDLKGVTRLEYNENMRTKMEKKLAQWLENQVESYVEPKSERNLLMQSRKKIHARYSIDDRFHITDGIYKKINRIRMMNFASTLMINPENADVGHIGKISLREAIQKTMTDASIKFELILMNPNKNNLLDAESKIANKYGGMAKGTVYSALATMYDNLTNDTIYKKLYEKNWFDFYTMKISMPFGILNIEFTEEYKRFNHIKVDLYSAEIGNEDERRSFIIWEKDDPENYRFFTDNFNHIKQSERICTRVKDKELAAWAKTWKEMSEKGNG